MRLGMIGMGRMGGNMAERLRLDGHEVVGFDRDASVSDVADLGELVAALGPVPRVVWVMVPSGLPTHDTITSLSELLGPGDLVVDGGNSNWRDSQRHAEQLAAFEISFVDAGVSGGVWGLDEGYCLMVGGADDDVALVRPALQTLAPAGGLAHVGPVGAGHFTKMVHNGIEYGLMQSYAEGFELLGASELEINIPPVIRAWGHGSVIRSWLLELLSLGLEQDPKLEHVVGYVEDSGEGRWTIQEAIRLGVPVNVLADSVFARFTSRQDDSPAMKVLALLRHGFGGHAVKSAGASPD
jgi:6-phosphogluconate dehydrogenase